MITKTALAALLTVSLFATGAVGFAQFSSSTSATINASAGNVNVAWTNPTTATAGFGAPGYATCSVIANNDGTLTVTAANLAPGDVCKVQGTLSNTGTLPATLTESVSGAGATWTYTDNLPATLGASSSATVTITVGLASGSGNAYQNATHSITVTVTGTAGT